MLVRGYDPRHELSQVALHASPMIVPMLFGVLFAARALFYLNVARMFSDAFRRTSGGDAQYQPLGDVVA